MSLSSLNRRVDKALATMEQRHEQAVEFVTYWGDELVPPGEGRIIVTEWNSPLEEQEEE